MAIELARTMAQPRPWGVVDLRPWSNAGHGGVRIGEIWYERPGKPASSSSLLLKLLFTSEPLSIQAMANRRRELLRSGQGAASKYDTARVAECEIGRYASPDDAVATHDKNFIRFHVFSFGLMATDGYSACLAQT